MLAVPAFLNVNKPRTLLLILGDEKACWKYIMSFLRCRRKVSGQLQERRAGCYNVRPTICQCWSAPLDIQTKATCVVVCYLRSVQCNSWHCTDIKSLECMSVTILPTFFYFIARLRRRRSTDGTQPNFAKRWTVNLSLIHI